MILLMTAAACSIDFPYLRCLSPTAIVGRRTREKAPLIWGATVLESMQIILNWVRRKDLGNQKEYPY
jgi:hypothetical protein